MNCLKDGKHFRETIWTERLSNKKLHDFANVTISIFYHSYQNIEIITRYCSIIE